MNGFDGPVTPEGNALAVRWENGEVVEANPATKPDPATVVLPGLVCGHLETGLAQRARLIDAILARGD